MSGLPMPAVAASPIAIPIASPTAAAERLAVTRERLRQALQAPAASPGTAAGGAFPGEWLDSLRKVPGAAVVLDAVRSWWARHPWRVATLLATDAARTVLQPVAQRHPLGLMLGALLLGGVLAWTRPWRWMLKPALLAGLLPQLFGKTLAQVPVSSWMSVLASLTKPRQPPASPPPAAAAGVAPVHGAG